MQCQNQNQIKIFKNIKMANQQGVNWISVLSFLQKQQIQSTIRQKQWNLQKYQLMQKINRLQAELDSNKIIINDLLNRIKLLEIALYQAKYNNSNPSNLAKNGSKSGKQQEVSIQKVQSLLQKYKLDVKIKDEDHKQFLNQILSQIGIDSKQVFYQNDSLNKNETQNSTLIKQLEFKLKQVGSINAHLDGVRKMFVNQRKDFLVTVSEDCLVKIWSYANVLKNKYEHLQPVNSYREHTGPLFSLTGSSSPFNPQQSIFLTGGSQGLIKYWKINNASYNDTATPIATWSCSKVPDSNSTIWDLSLNKNKLLSSSSDGSVNLYQLTQTQGNNLKYQYKQKQFNPTCIQWLSQQTFVHGCTNAPRAHLWDLTGKIRQKFIYQISKGQQNQKHQINSIFFSKNLKKMSFGCQDGAIRLFPINFNRMIRKIQLNSAITSISELKQWQIVCGTHSGNISIWDLRTYQKLHEFEKSHMQKYDEGVFCLWTQSQKILSGGADGLIKVFF